MTAALAMRTTTVMMMRFRTIVQAMRMTTWSKNLSSTKILRAYATTSLLMNGIIITEAAISVALGFTRITSAVIRTLSRLPQPPRPSSLAPQLITLILIASHG